MKYEPNTQAQPYSTLGEQVDYYAEQGKVMVVKDSWGKRRILIKGRTLDGQYKGVVVVYADATLKLKAWDRCQRPAKDQQDILGFITLTDEVDL